MKKFRDVYECNSITVNVTNACNLKCGYCFEKGKKKTFMNTEVAVEILKTAYNKVDKEFGMFTVNLFGGEPLLNWIAIKAMIDYSNQNKLDVRFGITTNLTKLTEEMIQYIDDNDIMLLVSIDGIKEVHDANRSNSYDVVEQNVKTLIERGLGHLLEARMTITPDSAKFMHAGVTNLISLGFNNICPMPVYDIEWGKEQLNEFAKQYKALVDTYINILNDKSNERNINIRNIDNVLVNVMSPIVSDGTMCAIGGNRWCAFDTNGDIYPCHQCPTSSLGFIKEDTKIGNIYTGVDTNKLLTTNTAVAFDREECKDCEGKSICKHGCPMENLRETGVWDQPTKSFCELNKIVVRTVSEFHNDIMSCSNSRSRMINVLAENLKLKKYFDDEVQKTDIFSVEYAMKIKRFAELRANLDENLLPSFNEYFMRQSVATAQLLNSLNTKEETNG